MPILGENGKVLVYDPDSTWRIWALQETYRGTADSGKYVPKINDFIVDYTSGETWRVLDLDLTTYIPTLARIKLIGEGDDFDDYDIILGQGPGAVYDTHRAYLDTSVRPFDLALEHRNFIHGTMSKYAKIFRGSVSEEGDYRVISAFYDGSGNMLGDQIPLELSNVPNAQNYATYSIPPCKTTEDMPNGEIVTVVVYSDTGHVVSKSKYIVERTSYIRSVNSPIKYITHINLESQYLSGTDPNLILYPVNVTLNSLNLIGVVNYSDGSKAKLPIDGTRFKVFGLENFVATVVGQELPVVITYTLAANESAYGTTVGATHHLSANYVAKTIEADNQYAVKLYGFPVWVNAVSGYRIEWFLYNLDRARHYNVTPLVSFNANAPAYDPTLYGVTQRLSVNINLQQISGEFANHIHTQAIDITLHNQGTEAPTNWTIGFDPGQNPPFGVYNQVKMTYVNQNLKYLDISLGAQNRQEWLERLYYKTRPLINPQTEAIPPEPDHFVLMTGSQSVEYPISQWASTITTNLLMNDRDTLFIKFFRRSVDNDIQLSIAGIPIHQQP